MARKKILFTVGSMNQTTQMLQIARYLEDDYDCYFSQFFGRHPLVRFTINTGMMERTILGDKFRNNTETFLRKNGQKIDYSGLTFEKEYDLAVLCNDMIMPKMFQNMKAVWVQEGMIDKGNTLSKIVKALNLPSYLARGTALNGLSKHVEIKCVASEGYREHFINMGVPEERLFVTGIPNFDNLESHRDNDFPHHGYVMVATSDIRETFGKEDRIAFLEECVKIADGRRLLIKLHPNEMVERCTKEIRSVCPPDTLIYHEGNTNDMIANCEELITQWSTVVYVGIALGKKVYSNFDLDELYRNTPVQNGGESAKNIADLCRAYLEHKGPLEDFLKGYKKQIERREPELVS